MFPRRPTNRLGRDRVVDKSDGSAQAVIRSTPREDLRRLLDTCGRPLLPAELGQLLGVSDRFVNYMLMDAMRSGRVSRLTDGRYETAMGRCSAEVAGLFQFVAECEENWRLSDGLGR